MRIKYNKIIGEIEEVYENTLSVIYTTEKIAGWNSERTYSKIIVNKSDCQALDNGLNSSWNLNIKELENIL